MSDLLVKFGHTLRATRAALLCVLALCLCALSSCGSCGDEKAIATLVEIRGAGIERDFNAERYSWLAAENGARFAIGDGIRTLANTSARLTLIDQTQLELAQNTTLRFLVDGSEEGEQTLNIEAGQVMLRVGEREMKLRTQIGLATLTAGSQLTLSKTGDNIDYDVALGEAQFRSNTGEYHVLKAGENVEVGIGMAVFGAKTQPPAAVEGTTTTATIGGAYILASVTGKGVRSRAAGSNEWTRLNPGDHNLSEGTELRTQRKDAVSLRRGDEQAQLSGAGDFVVGSGNSLVEARGGDLTVQASSRDVHVLVPGGSIQVNAHPGGSAASIRVTNDTGNVVITQGTGTLQVQGVVTELDAGQQKSWSNPNSESSDKPIEDSAGYYNVGVKAGESFVVHTPEVPASVRFDFTGRCPGEGVVELTGSKQRVRGKDQVNAVLPAVSTPYVVRCVDDKGAPGKKIVARGNVQVVLDGGTRRLPSKAPTSFVETDGRTYTIYYQNQLPEINVGWPNAPQSASYELFVDGQPMRLTKPEHLFRSGNLRDGSHQLSFQAQDRRSRTTTVEVRFDNAAPKASLVSPIDRAFKPGDTVTIEGVALETWKVSVEGGSVTMNADERFVGEIATKAERPDIAVRLAHPKLGVHYYLRRAAGSP